MSVRVLVVDDEAPARRRVATLLEGEPDAEIVGEAANGLEAVEAIRSLSPDLVFLDIQMPGMTGFEVIEAIGVDAMPAVVFVTAFDEFALAAFEVQAVDYLLKPFQTDRFQKAFRRAAARKGQPEKEPERIGQLLDAVRPGPRHLQRLVVRKGERILFVSVGDVLRLSADGNYVNVHTPDGVYTLRETLARLETRLDPERFARIHRSEIVNVDAIKEVQPWFHGDYVVILRNGEELRLSRRYSGRLLGSE